MTEQNKELFKEFVNYCESQPKEKRIDHSYWSTCAVGEFARTKGIELREDYLLDEGSRLDWGGCIINNKEKHFLESLFGVKYESFEDESLTRWVVNGYDKSYGEFTKFLKQYL